MSFFSSVFGGPTTTQKSNSNSNTQQNSQFNNQGSFENQSNQTQQQQQTGQTTGQQQSTSTTTPNLPSWYSSYLQSIPSMYQGLIQGMQGQTGPVYGAPQEAAQIQQINRQYGQANKDLESSLASRGALDSGNATLAQSTLAGAKATDINNFLSQIPLLNRQAQQQGLAGLASAIQGAAGFQPTNAFGATTTGSQSQIQNVISNLLGQVFGTQSGTQQQSGTSSGTSSTQQQGTQSQQTTPSLGGLISSFLGL